VFGAYCFDPDPDVDNMAEGFSAFHNVPGYPGVAFEPDPLFGGIAHLLHGSDLDMLDDIDLDDILRDIEPVLVTPHGPGPMPVLGKPWCIMFTIPACHLYDRVPWAGGCGISYSFIIYDRP
jgi:hypothetical protein